MIASIFSIENVFVDNECGSTGFGCISTEITKQNQWIGFVLNVSARGKSFNEKAKKNWSKDYKEMRKANQPIFLLVDGIVSNNEGGMITAQIPNIFTQIDRCLLGINFTLWQQLPS